MKWQWFLAIFPIIDHSQGHSSFSNPIQLVSIPCQTFFLFVNWSCIIFLWIALETWVLSTVMTGILYVTEAPPSIWSLLNEGNSARLWISAVWQGTRCVTFTFCARNDNFFAGRWAHQRLNRRANQRCCADWEVVFLGWIFAVLMMHLFLNQSTINIDVSPFNGAQYRAKCPRLRVL